MADRASERARVADLIDDATGTPDGLDVDGFGGRVLAALSAAGFAVVPVEATSTMLNEGGSVILLEEGTHTAKVADLVWAEMLEHADLARDPKTGGPTDA